MSNGEAVGKIVRHRGLFIFSGFTACLYANGNNPVSSKKRML